MVSAVESTERPITVYLTAQVLGVLLAAVAAWALIAAGGPVWGAVFCWLGVSVYLSRKRIPSEAIGSGLQVGALLVVVAPLAPYADAYLAGAELSPVTIATTMFGPALVFTLFAGAAYGSGLLLKRHARSKLSRRTRRNSKRARKKFR